MGLVTYIH